MSLEKGQGLITTHGIKFDGKCYTFPSAIKEQWFEKARIYGPIHVDVYFNSVDHTEIALLMNVGFVRCTSIEQNNTSLDQAEYYRTFQKLRHAKSRNKQ